MSKRFVFLDRDGTLVRDPGYVHRLKDLEILPGVEEGLRLLQVAGYHLLIVTNQSGIGRGYFGEDDFVRFQDALTSSLERAGIRIEATYHCPHTPSSGCACRKPATGMLDRACEEFDADLPNSWVIGDQTTDMELAERAGCRSIRIEPGTALLAAARAILSSGN